MGQYLTWQIDQNPATVGSGTSSVTLRLRVWYNATSAVSDSNHNFSLSGAWGSRSGNVSGGVSTPSGGGSDLIFDSTITVATSYTGTSTNSFSASMTGIEYWGASNVITASGSEVVERRPYQVPAAPSNQRVAYVDSDTNRVSWTNNSTTSGPYANIDLDVETNGVWTDLATLAGTATSYDHNGVSRANTYRYRVRSTNASGASAMVTTGYIYKSPAAVTGVTVTRTSDTQHTVSMTRAATSSAPYTSIKVQRREFSISSGWGSWSTLTTISTTYTTAGTQTYVDTSTSANRLYDYQIVVANDTGSATSAASGNVYTSPATPTASAAKNSTGGIVVTVSRNSEYSSVNHVVENSTNGGSSWTVLGTISGSTSPTAYTHASPNPSVTHTYRVKTVVNDATAEAGNALASGYATTATIQLATIPNPPTGLSPNGSVIDVAAGTQRLSWIHTSADTAPQIAYQLQRRAVGTTTWTDTGKVSSANSYYDMPTTGYTNATDIEWRVKTWGAHATGSEYSATATIVTSSAPTCSISTPASNAVIGLSSVTVAWSYYQAEGVAQAGWRLRLSTGGSVIRTLDGVTGTSVVLKDVPEGVYSLSLDVKSADGLWSIADVVPFTVSYLPPADVIAVCSYEQSWGYAVLTLYAQSGVPGVSIEADTVSVERSVDAGATWSPVLSAQDVNVSNQGEVIVIDPVPSSIGETHYRLTVHSTLPSQKVLGDDMSISVTGTNRMWLYYNYGPGLSLVVKAYGNMEVSSSAARETDFVYFEGATDPTAMFGQARVHSYSASFDLDDEQSSFADWEAAAAASDIGLVRDYHGTRAVVAMDGVDRTTPNSKVTRASAKWRKVAADD